MSGKPANTPAAAALSDDGTDPSSPLDLEAASGAAWASDAAPARRRWRVTSPRGTLILATIVKFAITLTGTMVMLPVFRVLEDVFCRRHFQDTSPGFIEEKRCKVAEVQQDLAYLMGWLMVVTGLVGESKIKPVHLYYSSAWGPQWLTWENQVLLLPCRTALLQIGTRVYPHLWGEWKTDLAVERRPY